MHLTCFSALCEVLTFSLALQHILSVMTCLRQSRHATQHTLSTFRSHRRIANKTLPVKSTEYQFIFRRLAFWYVLYFFWRKLFCSTGENGALRNIMRNDVFVFTRGESFVFKKNSLVFHIDSSANFVCRSGCVVYFQIYQLCIHLFPGFGRFG